MMTHSKASLFALLATAAIALPACTAGEIYEQPEPIESDELSTDAADDEVEDVQLVQYPEIARLHPDASSAIIFTREPHGISSDRFTIGVRFEGDDGATDYSGLMTEQNATSLELFLALSDAGQDPPRDLITAHADETAVLGRDSVAVLSYAAAHSSSDENRTFISTGVGSFSCANYSNFRAQLSRDLADALGRTESRDSDVARMYLYQSGKTGRVAGRSCNYNSGRSDWKRVYMCSRDTTSTGGFTTTSNAWQCETSVMRDGRYARKVWSGNGSSKDYRVYTTTQSHTKTSGYTGLVTSAAASAITCCTDSTGGHGCGTYPGTDCPAGQTICWGDCNPID